MRPALLATAISILAALPACSRCSWAPERFDASSLTPLPEDAEDPDIEEEPSRLPKRDWNGLTLMMRETEVREALEAIGFSLAPSRLGWFPILDVESRSVTRFPISGYTPPVVAYSTEKQDSSPLHPVYGLELWFFSNRLYAFQPVYFVAEVDLVEPEDEAVGPDVMRERLVGTFGDPTWKGRAFTLGPSGDDALERETRLWSDEEIVVVYGEHEQGGLPAYDLLFFSPRGNASIMKFVERLSGKTIPALPPDAE